MIPAKSEKLTGALTDDEREAWEERAAILEYEACIPRRYAEALALAMVQEARG